MEREKGIYLDNAATTPLSDDMKEYLIKMLDLYGNPSSSHSVGDMTHQLIIDARKKVAEFINANVEEIFFTPSGSASNTLAIRHFGAFHSCPIIYSPLCHKSVKEAINDYRIYSEEIPVTYEGTIDLKLFKEMMEWYSQIPDVPLVVITFGDSEIGTIQPIKEIIDITHKVGGYVYLDCTGSIPYIPVDVKALDCDMIGFSGHKLGALKGCGVFYKKEKLQLSPFIYGAQEQGIIGGTENVLSILSLGHSLENYNYDKYNGGNTKYLWEQIKNNIDNVYLIGSPTYRLPENLYICIKGVKGTHIQVMMDDLYNIQISTGSACNNYKAEAPMGLSAMGIPEEDWFSCIRFTLNENETKEELDYVVQSLQSTIEMLRKQND